MDQANEFLKNEYWQQYNKKYSKKALNYADLDIKLDPEYDINAIICIEKKKIDNEFIVRDENIL